jgi:hypothetical protein
MCIDWRGPAISQKQPPARGSIVNLPSLPNQEWPDFLPTASA